MKRHWEIDDLVEQWTLLPDELAWLGNNTGSTRLGFALLLKFFQIEGRFPLAKNEIPPPVIRFLAKHIGVPMAEYIHYDWTGRAIKHHRAQIRELLGFREATVEDAEALAAWLSSEVIVHEHRVVQLKGLVLQRCRHLRIEPMSEGADRASLSLGAPHLRNQGLHDDIRAVAPTGARPARCARR